MTTKIRHPSYMQTLTGRAEQRYDSNWLAGPSSNRATILEPGATTEHADSFELRLRALQRHHQIDADVHGLVTVRHFSAALGRNVVSVSLPSSADRNSGRMTTATM